MCDCVCVCVCVSVQPSIKQALWTSPRPSCTAFLSDRRPSLFSYSFKLPHLVPNAMLCCLPAPHVVAVSDDMEGVSHKEVMELLLLTQVM